MVTNGNSVVDIHSIYGDLASLYDLFCADIDYAQQADFAHRAANAFSASGGRSYLDLACGTGAHLQHMGRLGYQLTGLDLNPAMLQQAAQREPSAVLIEADMAALDHYQAYDLVGCFLYSIHYSHPRAALAQTLRRVWQALRPGGVFVFNAVDAFGARQRRQVISRAVHADKQLTFCSGWHYSGVGETLDLQLSITQSGPDGEQQWQDHHRMTAVSIPELLVLLSDCGYETTVLEHDYSLFRPWSGQSSNVIVIASRPV